MTGRKKVAITTGKHTQIEGALIANITPDGSDGGNLALDTGTLGYRDIQDRHTERSHYTRISASWETEGASQDRGNNSGYTQTTGQRRGDETGSSLDDRTTFGIEGSYSNLERRQINRATVGQGDITLRENPEQEITDLNRDIDKAHKITKDKQSHTELYVTETAVKATANIFSLNVKDDPDTPEDETQVNNTLTKWADNLADYGKNSTRQFIQMGKVAKAMSNSDNALAQLMGAVTQGINDTLDTLGLFTLGLVPGVENHSGLITQIPALVFGDQLNNTCSGQQSRTH